MLLKLLLTDASVPSAPLASRAVISTPSMLSPCSVSVPASPSTAPVSSASMSKVSLAAPPLRLKLLAAVTLKASVLVPPWRVAKPVNSRVLLPSL